MRYAIQIVAMLEDLMLIAATAILVYTLPKEPFAYIMAIIAYKAWHERGEFFAWDKKWIKAFMARAKAIGL